MRLHQQKFHIVCHVLTGLFCVMGVLPWRLPSNPVACIIDHLNESILRWLFFIFLATSFMALTQIISPNGGGPFVSFSRAANSYRASFMSAGIWSIARNASRSLCSFASFAFRTVRFVCQCLRSWTLSQSNRSTFETTSWCGIAYCRSKVRICWSPGFMPWWRSRRMNVLRSLYPS